MKQSLKALPKKLLAVFLALLTCLALLPSALYATSVSAEETTITIINLPRGGGTGWETNEVHLMNGWVVEANNHFPAISIGGENGQVAYCIQPGAELHTGSSLTQYGEDYWDTIPSNSSLAWYDVQAYIGRVMRYGYQGTNSLSWNASNPDHANAMGMEMATHVLIWEVLVGERDENFNKVDAHAYGCNNVLEMFPASYPIYNYIISNYNAIVTAVQSHVTIPSFMTNRTATATTVEMTWNANNQRYEAVLTDTNNVLGNFSFSTSDSSVSCSVAGNQLTVYSNNAPSGDVSITATKNAQSVGSVVWSDGIVNPNTGDLQDVVTYSATINDPLQAYINVKVSTGSLNIIKTAEDGNVAGIRMNISGNGINQDVTTGPDGSVRVDGLTPGTYTVTEYPSDIYVPQDPQQVTVVSGQTATVTFNNVLKWGYVSGLKVDRETGNTIAGATFGIFSENETEFTAETSLREPVITGADGKFTFHMPYGNYQIKELAPAPNYLPNDTIYQVSITENGQVIEITVTNDQVPEIGTEATVEGEKETHPFEQVTLTDTVNYQHLIPGQEYTISGVLMDKATGESFLVDGEEITSEVTFVPEKANGQVETKFTFDASGITEETELIVFESLYKDGVELTVHADIEDEGQTVTVKIPEIGTEATAEGEKEIHPFEQVTITDTVSYTNLIPDQEYTITGVLMDKATGEAFLVDGEEITSEVTFVPEEANGQVDAEFVFDASGITVNTDLVAFETLSQDGIELAVHADIEDEGQTVTVKVPDLHTTATIDGNKDAVKGGTVTIEDVVDYTGLIPGKEYTLTGVLMDKATGEAFLVNGQQVTSEVTFTPETADGSVTVTFVFDTSAITEDTSVVVFESLYQNGTELTTHADITDEAQTVTITVPAPAPQTGDNANLPIAMALGGLLLSLAAGGTIFFLLRRKRN